MLSYVMRRSIALLLCAWMGAALASCTSTMDNAPAKVGSMMPDVAAFEANPTPATYERLHTDISSGLLTNEAETRMLNRLLAGEVRTNVVDATLADLAVVDFLGTMRYLREQNLTSQLDSGPGAGHLTASSSRLSWVMLALRPYGDKTAIDLTRMNLSSSDGFVGQGMDLQNANFSWTRLPAGSWRNTDLTDTSFDGTVASGPLTCQDCTWGSAHASLRLSDGKWVGP